VAIKQIDVTVGKAPRSSAEASINQVGLHKADYIKGGLVVLLSHPKTLRAFSGVSDRHDRDIMGYLAHACSSNVPEDTPYGSFGAHSQHPYDQCEAFM
jgi:hypothetical protein